MAQLKSSSQTRIDEGDIAAVANANADAAVAAAAAGAGAAAEVAAGRTNSVKRADGSWSATSKQLPTDYALQTWADDLAIGAYEVYLTVAQQGLPAGNWYIEVMRYNADLVTGQYRYLRATTLNRPVATTPVYHCSVVNAVWAAWAPMVRKGNILKEIDQIGRSFGTGWAVGTTWSNFTKQVGSSVMLLSTIPMRNNSASWGGAYTRVEYSLDNGVSWASLGDTGYDTVMEMGASINHWNAAQLIDKPDIVASTQVRFRYQHRSYDGTLTIRSSNNITNGAWHFGQPQITLIEMGL